jgi:hypothetical protein
MASYLKMATVQHKARFSKRSPLSKHNVVTELNMKQIHLQIMLPDVG